MLIGKLVARTARAYATRVIALLGAQPGRVHSVTEDNGSEGVGYRRIERAVDARFYFATPYHAWERGTNEDTNGVIRQFVPKGHSMRDLTQRDCTQIARALNRRPRKRLGFRTRRNVFRLTVALQT